MSVLRMAMAAPLVLLALAGCREQERQELEFFQNVASESPSMIKLAIGQCMDDWTMREVAREPYLAYLTGVPKDQVLEVLCTRLVQGIARKKITPEDIMITDRIPANVSNVLRGG